MEVDDFPLKLELHLLSIALISEFIYIHQLARVNFNHLSISAVLLHTWKVSLILRFCEDGLVTTSLQDDYPPLQ